MSDRTIDFGRTADDYARHRPGFPDEFFDRLRDLGLAVERRTVVDLGTGTGTLARGFAARGARAIGIDRSTGMLAAAVTLRDVGTDLHFVRARAEATPLRDVSADLICAGQCWHWFDRAAAAAEVRRVLVPGGHALIAYFSYLPEPGSLGAATEDIVLRYQPGWEWAGKDGRYPEVLADLTAAGLERVAELDYVLDVRFTHESWRGRFRACNGVLTLPAEQIAAFDRDLARLLAASYPEPLEVPHRVYAILARKAGGSIR